METTNVIEPLLRWELLIIILIGCAGGLARSAKDQPENKWKIFTRIFLGAFWALSVVFVVTTYRAEAGAESVLKSWQAVIILLIGAVYADDALTLIHDKIIKRFTNGK